MFPGAPLQKQMYLENIWKVDSIHKIKCINILPNFNLIRLQVYAPKESTNTIWYNVVFVLSNPSIPEYPWQW